MTFFRGKAFFFAGRATRAPAAAQCVQIWRNHRLSTACTARATASGSYCVSPSAKRRVLGAPPGARPAPDQQTPAFAPLQRPPPFAPPAMTPAVPCPDPPRPPPLPHRSAPLFRALRRSFSLV